MPRCPVCGGEHEPNKPHTWVRVAEESKPYPKKKPKPTLEERVATLEALYEDLIERFAPELTRAEKRRTYMRKYMREKRAKEKKDA